MGEITNKVANSSLEVFDLEDYFPKEKIVQLDISQWLYEGFIVKEKSFREQLKQFDFSVYSNSYVALVCTTDAVLPAWAFTLVTVYLQPFALKVYQANKNQVVSSLYLKALETIDFSVYKNNPVILKGCSNKPVPQEVYTLAIQYLMPYAKSIMFGEACSAVPLYKKKQ